MALADWLDKLELDLMDTGNAIWDTTTLSNCIRQSLRDFSTVNPDTKVGTVTLAADGREVSLSTLTNLIDVLEVWWPYTAASPEWYPNRVKGWRQYILSDVPYLYFTELEGNEPQSGEVVRVFYTLRHTIEDLDSATATTFSNFEFQPVILNGAAGRAAQARAIDLIETANTDLYQVGLLQQYANRKLRLFYAQLDAIRAKKVREGHPWMDGWDLDKYDTRMV